MRTYYIIESVINPGSFWSNSYSDFKGFLFATEFEFHAWANEYIINNINTKPPHNGAVTHHQDQSIILVSFNVIKMRNMSPKNPIPPLLEFELLFAILKYI